MCLDNCKTVKVAILLNQFRFCYKKTGDELSQAKIGLMILEFFHFEIERIIYLFHIRLISKFQMLTCSIVLTFQWVIK